MKYPTLVSSYWDRYSNGIVEDATTLQRTNVASLIGDDGIVTNPYEAVLFLKGLVEGKLLTEATVDEMRKWVNDRQGEPTYGLGLDLVTMNGFKAYGHSGGGIGAGCELYYFPEKGLYSFLAINLGTVTDSPLHIEAGKAREALYDALLK